MKLFVVLLTILLVVLVIAGCTCITGERSATLIFMCEECGKVTRTYPEMREHMKIHKQVPVLKPRSDNVSI